MGVGDNRIGKDFTSKLIDSIPDHPAATDKIVSYLVAAPTDDNNLKRIADHLSDPGRAFYGWQNYLLWGLLAVKEYVSQSLLEQAIGIVEERPDGATRAGATLYAGAVGTNVDREAIANRFSTVTSFLGQRAALIAVHELPFRPVVENHVAPHVRADLMGVFRGLKRDKGRYFADPERPSITRFVDLERDYA